MTKEEKAKAYDEAVNKLRRFMEHGIDPLITRADVQDFFPELAESEDERIRKQLICGMNALKEQKKKTFAAIPIDDCIAWLEKQGEKPQSKTVFEATKEENVDKQNRVKTTNKIEPKFREGEWVVQGDNILKIKCVGDTYYCFETVSGYVDDMLVSEIDSQFHLWTIADAKDGDVLYSLDSNRPFIYKERNGYEQAKVYCGINIYGKFFVGNTKDCIITTDKYIPATKEQRDLLFAKIKDAGYEWDAEKKELRKIEQKPTALRKRATGSSRTMTTPGA